jgi:hypothetical protein
MGKYVCMSLCLSVNLLTALVFVTQEGEHFIAGNNKNKNSKIIHGGTIDYDDFAKRLII